MIQLQYQPKPTELTDQVAQDLTDKYKTTGESVWSKDYIKKALLKMSNQKCCYCEAKLNISGNDMEVEHFLPKSAFPDKAVEWENLLPACGHCNGTKNDLNPQITPIIHPVHDNPQDHLKMTSFYLRGRDDKGKTLVLKLKMNEEKAINPRFEAGRGIMTMLEELLEDAKAHFNNPQGTQNMETRIKNRLQRLMLDCYPEKPYSATCATILLNDQNYQDIRQIFGDENLWTAEFQALEDKVKKCALPEK
jgi:uncharacterized protein (TIGR02646 family)